VFCPSVQFLCSDSSWVGACYFASPVSHVHRAYTCTCLQYVANCTWADVAFAASYLARHVNSVTTDKFARVVDAFNYLHGTEIHGFHVGGSSIDCPLCVYCDADSSACPETRRSATGYVVKCGLWSIA
jgi:hypothetical protein